MVQSSPIDPSLGAPSVWRQLGIGRLLALGIFLAAFSLLLLALLAHLLPPGRVAATADIVTPLTLHAIAAGCVALLAFISRRWAWPVLALGLPAILVGHALGSATQSTDTPFSRTTLISARDHIRILSLNTWHAHPDIDQVERGIERANADVVVLLEVGPDKQPMLDRLSAPYPHRRSCADRWECSVAILSRFPIRAGDARRTQLELPPLVWAEIDASALGIGTLTVVGAHVHRPSRSPRLHRLHMRALSALALNVPGPLIVAGDFNTGTLSASWRELVSVSSLRGSAQWAPTWPAIPLSAPQVDLDHILISPSMEFGRTGTGPHVGSDHIGIWAEVRLPALLPIKKIDHASVFQWR